MKARTRPILVLAVTTALVIPLSMAQIAAPKGKAIGQAAAQVPPPSPRSPPPTLPLSASTAAAAALLNTNAPPSPQTLNETEPLPPPEVEQAAMNPPQRPAQSQGAVNAASRSTLAPRGIWAQLDVNGDGRISGSEGQVDADFKANFEMMDANRDGFVTAGEYRAQAQSDQPEPEEERDD